MKRVLFFILLLLSSCVSAEDLKLNKDKLVKSNWGPDGGGYGLYIKFFNNDSYELSFAGEGGTLVNGKYEIKNNTLTLIPKDGNADEPFKEFNSKLNLEYVFDSKALVNSIKLNNNDGISFFDQKSKPDMKEAKKINDVEVVSTGIKIGKITTKSYIRNGAGTKYEYYIFDLSENAEEESFTTFLPIGHEIKILAKTLKEETINGKKGCWYYCDVNLDWYTSIKLNNEKPTRYYTGVRGWIFSPLVEIK